MRNLDDGQASCPAADAKLLAAKGADVVAVDQTDAGALRAALDGAYGAFYVTVSLEIAILQAEFEQGVLISLERRAMRDIELQENVEANVHH